MRGIGVTIKASRVDVSVLNNTCHASLASGAHCEIIFQSEKALGSIKAAITSTKITKPIWLDIDVKGKD